tara:strand:+ start:535 stop:702 length:168 start_codon:yes stop_codon:yes gene_type:complete
MDEGGQNIGGLCDKKGDEVHSHSIRSFPSFFRLHANSLNEMQLMTLKLSNISSLF